MSGLRERPSDNEIDAWVHDVRSEVIARTSQRSWWKRISRPSILLGVAGIVAAGGIAYASVERTRTAEAPEVHAGNSTVEIGKPGPGDEWLSISVVFRCEKGERISIRDDAHELMESGCPKNGTDSYGHRGMSGSKPRSEIRGTQLTVVSSISRDYRVEAKWSKRATSPGLLALPPVGADGKPKWVLPTYPVNEYGLTVGDQISLYQPESSYPDLMPTTYKGRTAYFRTKDTLEWPNTTAEVERQQRERRRLGLDVGRKQYRFVYAADGKTILGKKRIN